MAKRRGGIARRSVAILGAGSILVLAACAIGIDDGLRPAVEGPGAACAQCHRDVIDEVAPSPIHRDGRGPGCLVCHEPHEEAGADGFPGASRLRAGCEDCHASVVAEFRFPFQHPLARVDGCTDCHDPHAGRARTERERLRHDACVDCHLETAGPFLFEHEGDRTRGCLSCHEPHGSANRRLLTYADSRSLCMSCHLLLDVPHINNAGSIYNDCLDCHTEVHGSNWQRELLR